MSFILINSLIILKEAYDHKRLIKEAYESSQYIPEEIRACLKLLEQNYVTLLVILCVKLIPKTWNVLASS